jgi:hypothetical protein
MSCSVSAVGCTFEGGFEERERCSHLHLIQGQAIEFKYLRQKETTFRFEKFRISKCAEKRKIKKKAQTRMGRMDDASEEHC